MNLIGDGNESSQGVFTEDLQDLDEEFGYEYDQDETYEVMKQMGEEDFEDTLDYGEESFGEDDSEEDFEEDNQEGDKDVGDKDSKDNDESEPEKENLFEYVDGDEKYIIENERLNELVRLGTEYDDRILEIGDLDKEDLQLMNDIKKGDMLAIKKAIGDVDIHELFDVEEEWKYKEKETVLQISKGYDEEGYKIGIERLDSKALDMVKRPEELNKFLKEDKKNGDVIYNKALKRAKITGMDKKEAYAYEIVAYYKKDKK